MKAMNILGLAAFFLISFSCKDKATSKINNDNVEVAANRDEVQKKLPVISFEKNEHDFGTIVQGTPQETIFKFTNTGDAPLVITDARSTCGCTVPEYPKNTPIAPGESGELLVKFNGSGNGAVTKTVTLTANTEKGSESLRIKAHVNPKNGEQLAVPMKKG
ncbi:DUF1573 domain-containing protein [Allomuricauda sp. SCSIO 65647]|uniref:DUF1573 domain-containing protein n=1 Tax=Allomuricauda sp. SCSIO 65647 TaxID=2908843 RepID=UPI001F25DCF1|nr:DUF1573 domain-containing protein [Muricauda sp. SCSIO 65647]UJH66803.1 DUF1573 domain-containing protein [Muricauda sp. SCSIO 65647]